MKRAKAKQFQDLIVWQKRISLFWLSISIVKILPKDVGYIDTKKLESRLEEVSKLLEAYSKAILDSVSWLLASSICSRLNNLHGKPIEGI